MKAIHVFLIVSLVCFGSFGLVGAQAQNNKLSGASKFNVSDKSFDSNGNLQIAFNLLRGSDPSATWKASENRTVVDITRSPYSSLGKLIKLTGKLSEVEELPPALMSELGWYSLLVMAPNPNNALGGTLVELIYHGDALKIPPQSIISFAGYFVGTFRDASPAHFEQLVVVGNSIQIEGKKP